MQLKFANKANKAGVILFPDFFTGFQGGLRVGVSLKINNTKKDIRFQTTENKRVVDTGGA